MSPCGLTWALAFVAVLFASFGARGQETVYENSLLYSGKYNQSTNEYGDEVILSGTARYVTQFQFEYFGDFVSQGDELARVRFYANTGPAWMGNQEYKTPAAPPLWETTLPIGSGFRTASLAVPSVLVPDTFTFTVQFFGVAMKPGDAAGLLFYGLATNGRSFNDFWQLGAAGWTPVKAPGVLTNNFAAKIMAVSAAPPLALLTATREGSNLRLSWPATSSGLSLESKESLDATSWTVVNATPVRNGNNMEVVVPIESGNRIFRLTSQPQQHLEISHGTDSIRLRWPSALGGYRLQTRTAIDSGTWTDAPTPSRANGAYFETTFPISAGNQFFRLTK